MHNDELEDEVDKISNASERREKDKKEPGGIELSRTTNLLNEILNLKLSDLEATDKELLNSPLYSGRHDGEID